MLNTYTYVQTECVYIQLLAIVIYFIRSGDITTSGWRTSLDCISDISCFSRCYIRPLTENDIANDCSSSRYFHILCGMYLCVCTHHLFFKYSSTYFVVANQITHLQNKISQYISEIYLTLVCMQLNKMQMTNHMYIVIHTIRSVYFVLLILLGCHFVFVYINVKNLINVKCTCTYWYDNGQCWYQKQCQCLG